MAIARALSASAAVALCGIAVLATVPARAQDYSHNSDYWIIRFRG